MKKIAELSVFFPTYNEEANIKSTVTKAMEILPRVAERWEILIVDDGSTDKTGKIADQLAKESKNIHVIHHPKNRGYGGALKSGLYNCRYPWIVFTDADGQFDLGEITKFLEKINSAEVIVGYRLNRQDPFLRKLFGWGWTQIANLLLGINVRDVDCGFKLVKKEVIEKIPKLESTRGGMISPELLAKAQKNGFKSVEVGVHHYPRKEGTQSGANLKVIFRSFLDLFRLWGKLRGGES